MIPFGLSQSQFSVRYQRELDLVTPHVIAALRELMAMPVNPGVESARVDIFLDEHGGLPSVCVYYRGDKAKAGAIEHSPFAGGAVDLQLPLNALADFDERYFISIEGGEPEFPGLALAGKLMKFWVAKCWWRAGGWAYPVPTKLSVHGEEGEDSTVQLTEAGRPGA